jgi:tRNA(Arg) A34 adenosine deaminase TadA
MNKQNKKYINRAIQLAEEGMNANTGGPFGCVIVKDDKIISEGYNCVTSTNDPTAHAEIVAIRKACKNLNSFQLEGCSIYASCEPCPMCLGAIYWARPDKVYFACTKSDAAQIDFDDQFIYDEMKKKYRDRSIKFIKVPSKNALRVFQKWEQKSDKIIY